MTQLVRRIAPRSLRIWLRLRYAAVLGDLPALARGCGTDKWGEHWYAQHYARHFNSLRHRRLNVLEIGVGGGYDPMRGGASLRMWKHYFPRSRIFGIDIYEKKNVDAPRIKVFRGDQGNSQFLRNVVDEMRGVDIVIDDGSHRNSDVIASFETLFPLLNKDGLYCIEDLQTSYWQETNDKCAEHSPTVMTYFKHLIDGLNWQELLIPDYEPSYTDVHVTAMHWYHNLLIIKKGVNREGSNFVAHGQLLPSCH